MCILLGSLLSYKKEQLHALDALPEWCFGKADAHFVKTDAPPLPRFGKRMPADASKQQKRMPRVHLTHETWVVEGHPLVQLEACPPLVCMCT